MKNLIYSFPYRKGVLLGCVTFLSFFTANAQGTQLPGPQTQNQDAGKRAAQEKFFFDATHRLPVSDPLGPQRQFAYDRPVSGDGYPNIRSVEPNNGIAGTVITINGYGFDDFGAEPKILFTFNNPEDVVPATILSRTDDSFVVVVPKNAIDGKITINGILFDSEQSRSIFRVESTLSILQRGWKGLKNRRVIGN